MSGFQERLRSALERAIISSNARTEDEIRAVLLAFRAIARRRIESIRSKNPSLAQKAMRIVDETVAEYEMTSRSDETISSGTYEGAARNADYNDGADAARRQTRSILRPFLAGAVSALCVGALALLLANRAGYLSPVSAVQNKDEAAFTIPAEDVAFARSVMPAVIEAAEKAQQLLAANADSASVADGKGFRPLREVFPELWQSIPVSARRSVNMMLRKEGAAYKLLFASSLCPLIVAESDMEKDPRREANEPPTTLCTHFSVWNEGGEKF